MKALQLLETLRDDYIHGELTSDIEEAIKELEDLETKDRLAELEKVILDYYLDKGYKLFENQTEADNQWFFRTLIQSLHKQKELIITFCEAGEKDKIVYIKAETTKEMFDKAFEHFTIKAKE